MRYRYSLAVCLLASLVSAVGALSNDEPTIPIITLPRDELVPTSMCLGPASETPDWGVTHIGCPDAWKTTKGKGVTVAVLDTGADQNHRDLKGQITAGKNFTNSSAGWADVQGHGTHCAGVVAGAANDVGLVGVAPEARLLIGKVLGDNGAGASTWIAAGIDWAVDQGADVISMSLGGPSPDQWTKAAVQRATERGVIVVAAAGNEGPGDNTVGYPGGYPECVCVAAIDSGNRVATFSSRGPNVYVSGPGVNIRSAYPGDRFATMSGTSMATPHVAGVAALWVAAHPEIPKAERPAKFKAALAETCVDLDLPGRDRRSGFGLAQPVKLVAGGTQPMPPVPPPAPGVIEVTLGKDDLTPAAWDRLQKAFPGFEGITFRKRKP